jgi:hypothetical protein
LADPSDTLGLVKKKLSAPEKEIPAAIRRPFRDLVLDSIFFSQKTLGTPADDPKERARYARSAVFSVVASLECASNLCTDNLEGGLKKDLEWLPFLSKFDLFVHLSATGRTLDRGVVEVERVQELKSARDRLARPKSRHSTLRLIDDGVYQAETTSSTRLGLSDSSEKWTGSDCVAAVKAADRFLSLVFFEICDLPQWDVARLLLSEVTTLHPPGGADRGGPVKPEDPLFEFARSEWQLSLRYLGLR